MNDDWHNAVASQKRIWLSVFSSRTDDQMTGPIASPNSVSRASVLDTLVTFKDVILPTLTKGPLIRRRKVVAFAERNVLDDKAVKRMQKLRTKYGPGPLVLRIPFRRQAVLLSAEDARLVLEHSPEPFAAASLEKRSALSHFEPDVVLASQGEDRISRRKLNELTLETKCQMHSLAELFATVVLEEMEEVSDKALQTGTLDWDAFFEGWYRMVRRIVLGSEARDDAELTDLLEDLRYRANFAFLRPKDRTKREAFLRRVRHYVEHGDPNSLAGKMGTDCNHLAQQPHHQLPQYLFAFDPGAMASFRTLALLSSYPEVEQRVRDELDQAAEQVAPHLELVQACFLEALRLWPTTPAILRETTAPVKWKEGQIDENTQVLIFAPFFHRDDEKLDHAHVFGPDVWLGRTSRPDLALMPFSHGPVICPAASFVPMISSFALRSLLSRMTMKLNDAYRVSSARLPGTLDNYTLSFSVTPRAQSRRGTSRSTEPPADSLADRKPEGLRHAGMSPWPTDMPIGGGDRGDVS